MAAPTVLHSTNHSHHFIIFFNVKNIFETYKRSLFSFYTYFWKLVCSKHWLELLIKISSTFFSKLKKYLVFFGFENLVGFFGAKIVKLPCKC